MKKQKNFLLFFMLVILTVSSGAQERTQNALYEVIAEAGARVNTSEMANEMVLRFNVFNRLFRFDPSLLGSPLRVRVFTDKQAYDKYITDRLGTTRNGALYLHYNQADRRELVVHLGSPETAPMLAHQAFIQYFRAFIANPPSWMREGFAIFYSTLRVASPDTVDYEENLFWLNAVKSMGARLPPPNALFHTDISEALFEAPLVYPPLSAASEEFQISSWALISFMLNSGRDNFRTLTDCFMLLSPSATIVENSRVIMKRLELWNDFNFMNDDFRNYIASRKTFRELMDDGHSAYSRGDFMSAELSFIAAMDQRPSDFAPYYYIGLLYYEEKDFETADYYYKASEERGADQALINYALGINAASAGRIQDAAVYLQIAAALDPGRYRQRVEELLRRIGL